MKYLEYTAILLWHILSKVIGLLWFFAVVPFRRYANNIIFNYVLQNGIYLKRLQERTIVHVHGELCPLETLGWEVQPYHNTTGGLIKYRKVSWVEYKLVYWLIWGFLDADANDDTFDYGRVEELRKESLIWKFLLQGAKRKQYGNAFDLGDARLSNFHFFASMFWNTRNTAQNFLYMQFQKQYQPFCHTVFGKQFGWVKAEDGNSYQLSYGKSV